MAFQTKANSVESAGETESDTDNDGTVDLTDQKFDRIDEQEDATVVPTMREKLQALTWLKVRAFLWRHSELICYIFFLFCFTIMSALGRTHLHFNYTQTEAVRTLLTKSLFHRDLDKDINNIGDVYNYLDTIILPILFDEYRVNGTFIENPLARYYINSQNARVLGAVRIKQNRHKRTECEVARDTFPTCYDEGSGSDDTPFVGNGHWSASPFNYYTADDLDDPLWAGTFDTYDGGGYVVDLVLSYGRQNASLILQELKNGEWIDGGTKAIFIDFVAFDPSTVLHTIGRIALEMPANGIFSTTDIKTWKLYRYMDIDGTALAVFHVFFLLFIVGYTIEMGYRMYQEGVITLFAGDTMSSYWSKTPWRKLEFINMILWYILLGLFVRNDYYTENLIELQEINEYHSFRSLQYSMIGEVYIQALAGFFLYLRALKYLRQYHGFRFFYAMFDASAPHLVVFFTVLGIFFTSFAVLGFLLFSSDLFDYRTFWMSLANMMRYTVSDIEYSSLTVSSRIMGSVFWFGWTICIILVLLNVFIGIITQAYNEAMDALDNEDEEDEIDKSEKVINIVAKFGAARMDQLDDDGNGKVTPKELAQVYPITVEEARAFVAHYDKDNDGTLDHEEFERVIEEAMQKRDEDKKRKQKEKEERDRRERERQKNEGKWATREDIQELSKQMKQLATLLEAALNTTVDGSRAVKRVKGTTKKPKLRSRSSSRKKR